MQAAARCIYYTFVRRPTIYHLHTGFKQLTINCTMASTSREYIHRIFFKLAECSHPLELILTLRFVSQVGNSNLK